VIFSRETPSSWYTATLNLAHSFLTMLHFLVVALAGHAKSAPQRRWKMGSESSESGFKQGHPAFLFFAPYTILRKSTFSGDITLGRRLVKATLGEQRIVVRRSELCLPFGAFREQTIALR
jgi:hypothetical protein